MPQLKDCKHDDLVIYQGRRSRVEQDATTGGYSLQDCETLKVTRMTSDAHVTKLNASVDHPQHYGGADNVYEAIKVIDAWRLGFSLGNTVKYIARAGRKLERVDVSGMASSSKSYIEVPSDGIEDLKKARWYLDHEIKQREEARDAKKTD
jgi:hypothetical protein